MTAPHRLLLASAAVLVLAACGEDEPQRQLDPEVATLQAEAAAQRAFDLTAEADFRVRTLMQSIDISRGHYDRDTGDILELLVEKLAFSATEVLHRTKEDLASLGALAVPVLAAQIDTNFENTASSAAIQNALEVLGLMEVPEARVPILRCLDHPRDTVRSNALRALSRGLATADDFDRLMLHAQTEGKKASEYALIAACKADPNRAAELLLDWISAGVSQTNMEILSAEFHRADPGMVGERAAELLALAPPPVDFVLAAKALEAGHPAGAAWSEPRLASENPNERMLMIGALADVGAHGAFLPLLDTDPDGVIRTTVIGALHEAWREGEHDVSDDERNRLHAVMDDPNDDVRKVALAYLLDLGDARAEGRALALLDGDRFAMQDTMLVLSRAMQRHPELAGRVFDKLRSVDEANAHRPIAERLATLQGIGQVPQVEAAQYLWDLAQEAQGELQGLRAHRWLTTQASNTSDAGRAWLGAKLALETDFSRRLDLIWAAASQRTEGSRAFLMEFLEGDPEAHEALFAAERLAQMGPATRVAPLLKRVGLRIDHGRVRVAFDALLWRWY